MSTAAPTRTGTGAGTGSGTGSDASATHRRGEEVAIRARGLAKRYRLGGRNAAYDTLRDAIARTASSWLRSRAARDEPPTFWALDGVDLDVRRGEVVGVVGRNGAGKSTLLKVLSRITTPTRGRLEIRGRVGSLLEVGTGFHPELTGRENIFLNGAILGMRRREILDRFDEIVAFSEVERFLDTPVKRYSSGMHVRLAFAVAAHLDTEVLLVDEVLAVGDGAFQRKCIGKIGDIAGSGRTVVFVSHQLSQVRRLCHRALWLRGGRIEADGEVGDVLGRYESHMSAGGAPEPGQRFVGWTVAGGGHRIDPDAPGPGIVVDLALDAPVRKGHVGLAVLDADARVAAGWNFDEVDIDRGRHRLHFDLEQLPLRPGPYTLQVALFDRGSNQTGGIPLEVWHAVPGLSVEGAVHGHSQDTWAGVLNVPASLRSEPVIESPSERDA